MDQTTLEHIASTSSTTLFQAVLETEAPPQLATVAIGERDVDARLVRQPEFSTWEPVAVALEGGGIGTDAGAAIDRHGRFIRESFRDQFELKRNASAITSTGETTLTPGRIGSLIGEWSHSFYHWLIECLPKLATLRATELSFDGFLVPADLKPFHLATLDDLGIHEGLRVPYFGQPVFAEEMVWAQPLFPPSFPNATAVKWLVENLRGSRQPSAQPRRVYLSRSGSRRVSNESRHAAVLKSAGFELLNTDAMSYRDLVEVFSSAKWIVGPHGAAFANCIFSERANLYELYQSDHVNVSITSLAAASGHRHFSTVLDPRRSRHALLRPQIAIPVKTFAANLEAFLVASESPL